MIRPMRRTLAGLCVVGALAPLVMAPHVALAETPAEEAAREIADAREYVNQLAQQIFDAQLKIEELEAANVQLETEIAAIQDDITLLQEAVEEIAVDRFTQAGSLGVPLLTGFQSPAEQVQINELLSVVNTSTDEAFDQLDSLIADLNGKQAQLDAQRIEAENERASLESLQKTAEEEVQRLKDVEEERLKDEQVRLALEAELRERQRQEEAKRQQAAQIAAANQASAAQPISLGDSGAEDDDSTAAGNAPVNSPPAVGETGGGRTGGGASSAVGGIAANIGPGWFCPTGAAFVPFENTWGAPRSGGRSHQGVDMIGPKGTPLYAVEDGVVTQKENALGGLTVSLVGASGNRYYYAHLDRYAASGGVVKGTVIGYMGDTGNARYSTPHLHFEIHPGGGVAVNPYPTARDFCPGTG
jgi:peptidoglycan LD-endopeptidase LytH